MINTGRSDAICDIGKVEAKYKAKWVGQFPLKTKDGGWSSDSCADVYYQVIPPVEGYSHYFGLIIQDGSLYITSAKCLEDKEFQGIRAKNGEIIYSRFRHDMRYSEDKSVWVDGGFDYMRRSYGPLVNLKLVYGEIHEI
jgi:hypothetical protein